MSACASMCTSNMNTPQAAIIQGPPGTGKSTTIAAMVLQIIFRWKRQYPGKYIQVTYFSCIRVRSPILSAHLLNPRIILNLLLKSENSPLLLL